MSRSIEIEGLICSSWWSNLLGYVHQSDKIDGNKYLLEYLGDVKSIVDWIYVFEI